MSDGTHYVLLDRVRLEPLCGNRSSPYGCTVTVDAVTCSECQRRIPPEWRVARARPLGRLRAAAVALAGPGGEPAR